MTSGVGIKSWGEKLQREQVKLRCEFPKALSNHFSLQSNARNLNFIFGPRKEDIPSNEFAPVESECSANVQAVQEGANLPQTDGCLKSLPAIMCMQSDDEVGLALLIFVWVELLTCVSLTSISKTCQINGKHECYFLVNEFNPSRSVFGQTKTRATSRLAFIDIMCFGAGDCTSRN